MITQSTIDKIFNAAQIEEVIGEFVSLKRSGSSYKGLSPFSDERSPSFMVSPSKQIFKDFSSGKGGTVVTFLMEHEQMSYPESLRFLANKYNIVIEETLASPEEEELKSHRESLFIVSQWAQKEFAHHLVETDSGRAIGLSYFKERGFTDETILTFGLGYAMDSFDSMVNASKQSGHRKEYLIELGLIKENDKGIYDGFKGRVIFPIQNLSGRPIGFGGRTLKTDKKIPKYINSPECEIYHKSRIVYGIFQAKKSIVKEDVCYLVEGYTDVISLHQSGIHNVVASAGTALTADQVRLIGRYTKNITILYDADPAGIKASFVGIDLILSEGLNVKAMLLPKGNDPDSFAQSHTLAQIQSYFASETKDFILFKTQILAAETLGDPIKRADLIRNIVHSIAIIPDEIMRSVYTKECGTLLDITEKILITEINKLRLKKHTDLRNKQSTKKHIDGQDTVPAVISRGAKNSPEQPLPKRGRSYFQEKDILRLMLNYGEVEIEISTVDDSDNAEIIKIELADFMAEEISADELNFEDPLLREAFDLYLRLKKENPDKNPITYMSRFENTAISELVAELATEKYQLHKWDIQNIEVHTEVDKMFRAARDGLYAFKVKKIEQLIDQKQSELKEIAPPFVGMAAIIAEIQQLRYTKAQLCSPPGIIIT